MYIIVPVQYKPEKNDSDTCDKTRGTYADAHDKSCIAAFFRNRLRLSILLHIRLRLYRRLNILGLRVLLLRLSILLLGLRVLLLRLSILLLRLRLSILLLWLSILLLRIDHKICTAVSAESRTFGYR